MNVLERVAEIGIVPVVELADPELALPLADALVAGGLPCIEITFRTDAARPALELLSEHRPDLLLAAGTVLSVEQAAIAVEAGADLIVAPGTSPAVVDYCASRGVAALPGVCTPSEVELALAHGVCTVKFFPAEASGGIGYLRALCGPYRSVRFVPTGGIAVANLRDYVALPQVIAVGGSWLASPTLLGEARFDEISLLAAEAVRIVAEARS